MADCKRARVCYACWVSARRNVQRRRDGIPDQPGPSHHRHHSEICVCCQTSLHRRQTHILTASAEREFVLSRIIIYNNNNLSARGKW